MTAFKQQLLYITDVEKITGRDRQTLRRWWNKGLFPKPRKIMSVLVWNAEILQQWIDENVPAKSTDA